MRIQKTSSPAFPVPVDSEARHAPPSENVLGGTHDSARISEIARQVSSARTFVENAPDVRELRVRALKKAVQNGSYQPDPEEVARKLLAHGI